MPVDVSGDARLGVTCPALDRIDRCAVVKQDRDRGITQIVEADIRQTGFSKDAFERERDLGLVDISADAGREDHAVFLPAVACNSFLHLLPLTVLFQQGNGHFAHHDVPSTGLGLGRDQFRTAPTCLLELPFDPQAAFLPVHIRPHQPKKLALAQASGQGKVEDRFVGVASGRCQKGARLFFREDLELLCFHPGARTASIGL